MTDEKPRIKLAHVGSLLAIAAMASVAPDHLPPPPSRKESAEHKKHREDRAERRNRERAARRKNRSKK